jgi:hypothetical protein
LLAGAFAAVGMLISSLTHRTATSLIVCMIVWVFLVLVLPSAVGFVSTEFGFSEDAREFNRSLRTLYQEYDERIWLVRYYDRDYFLMANNQGGEDGQTICRIIGDNATKFLMGLLPQAISAQNEFAAKRFDLESHYYATRKAKTELTDNLMRLSPSSLYGNIVNAFTRTDTDAHEDFIARARRYREEVIEFIRSNSGYTSKRWFTNDVEDTPYRDLVRRAETMTQSEMGMAFQDPQLVPQFMRWVEEAMTDPARRLDLSGMPRFRMEQPSLAAALASASFDILLLVVFTAVCITLTYIRFFRYDPR